MVRDVEAHETVIVDTKPATSSSALNPSFAVYTYFAESSGGTSYALLGTCRRSQVRNEAAAPQLLGTERHGGRLELPTRRDTKRAAGAPSTTS